MKKLFLAGCLIVAFPLMFSGQSRLPTATTVVAQVCGNDVSEVGNCAAYEPGRHRHLNAKGSKESGNPESTIVVGIGIFSLMFTLWAMRL